MAWQDKYPYVHRVYNNYIARCFVDENGVTKYAYNHTTRSPVDEMMLGVRTRREFLENWKPKGIILNRRF